MEYEIKSFGEFATRYTEGFSSGMTLTVNALGSTDISRTLVPLARQVILDRIYYHSAHGNKLIGYFVDENDMLDFVSEISYAHGNMAGNRLIMFYDKLNVRPIFSSDLQDTETESRNVVRNKTIEKNENNTSNNSNTYDGYSASEIAPINSSISEMHTPSNKNKSQSSSYQTANGEYTANNTDNESLSDDITRTHKNYKYLQDMLDFYLKNGNIFVDIINEIFDEIISERVTLF